MSALVLIPGMMCDARMWGPVPEMMTGTKIIHALPVMGETITEMAQIILENLPERFALAGLSMGGIVAMEMLRLAPKRIERLALMDTNPLAEAQEIRARRTPQIVRALSGDLAGVMQDDMIPRYFADPADKTLPDLCLAMAHDLGEEVFCRQSLALRERADQTETLAGFQGPALILMGCHDALCPRERHELMHHLMPASRLVMIEGAGHIPPLEQPKPTITALREWLYA